MSSKTNIPIAGKVLLMGNPNVGKSVFFTELTGIHTISANFTGTTVSYTEGDIQYEERSTRTALAQKSEVNNTYRLVDVPGTYSLNPTSEAERVAVEFLNNSNVRAVICVLDASNLERNLRLALELRQYNIPIIYALNLLDVAERRGISIKAKLLAHELGAPVIPTVAVKKRGIDEIKKQLEIILSGRTAKTVGNLPSTCQNCDFCPSKNKCDLWTTAKEITRRVCTQRNSPPSFTDKLGDSMMNLFPGIPIAVLVIGLLIATVIIVGKALQSFLLEPLVENIIVPFFRDVFSSFIPEGVFLNILVGEFGVFVISFEWILAAILPYVFLFYATFSFLEDSGYLPRISILFDNIMRKIGVQGGSLIYTLMGFGCAVPAIIGTRASTSYKERIVISTAVCFAVPCISQTGALISLLSGYYWWLFPVLILFGILVFILTAKITGKLVKGTIEPLLIEVPNLLLPEPKAYARKLAARMKHFLLEAEFPMLIAIIVAALLKETGLLETVSVYASPLVSEWLGLPKEAVVGLLLGIIRREMSVAPLLALDLSPIQAFTGGIVSLLYLPCLSVFGVLAKEFKLKTAVIISVLTIGLALLVGGIINQIAILFGRLFL